MMVWLFSRPNDALGGKVATTVSCANLIDEYQTEAHRDNPGGAPPRNLEAGLQGKTARRFSYQVTLSVRELGAFVFPILKARSTLPWRELAAAVGP
jgi:hypothetical protein